MKKTFLPLTILAFVLLGVLVAGVSLGWAQGSGPVPDARPTATPDIVLPDVVEEPSSPEVPPLPDLIVESIEFYPAEPVVDEVVTIHVTIANQGPVDLYVGNNFYVDLYIDPAIVPIQLGQDGVYAWLCQSYWVPAGGSHTLETTYVFDDVRVYSLYAQVDTDGHVAEGNENNNVLGPVQILVKTRDEMTWQTHQDFQMGLASGLDISHPDGVIRRGLFDEPPDDLSMCSPNPDDEGIYSPDIRINDSVDGDVPPSTVSQIKPALTGDDESDRLFAVWEDNRHSYFNRDIYFARSDDGGDTWGANVQITTDTAQQASPDLVYADGVLYAVWQDRRNGDYDIYGSVSADLGDTWSAPEQISDDPGMASQLNPSMAVGPLGGVYVVWQDQRNNNDDVYLARWEGTGWSENYFVTDDPHMTLQDQVAPSIDVSAYGLNEFVYVTWEDWRDQDHPEVYVARSVDGGQTFGIDVPVSIPAGGSYRRAPSIIVSQLFSGTLYIDTIHVAWQQGGDENADIYWSFAVYPPDEADPCPWPYEFCFEMPEQINGFVIDSEYVRPPNSGGSWPIEPSWQGQVSMARADEYDLTWCHADNNEDIYQHGAFLAWSDGASFDEWRYEIQTRRVGCFIKFESGAIDVECDPCEDAGTGVVNNNVKLYAYRNDLDEYRIFGPAAAGLFNPSIYARPPSVVPDFGDDRTWPLPELHLAWDDDRWDEPVEPSTVRNRDVYYTKSGYTYDQAVFISNAIDSYTQATWYALSWWGATQHYGDLLLQTRFGNTPYPPRCDEERDGWTRWTGNPSAIYTDPPFNGCDAGEGCYYDAPGRPIVAPDGSLRPESRYIQYKVTIRGFDRLTALSQVTVFYEGPILTFLPLVSKNY